jgi:KaiC/GvpD/RAD55 family RecA-like ATPase
MERRFIKSGIAGLDELLGGGILEGSIITVSGPTGSGKSTLAAQFICNGALESDEPGVYIAIEEGRKDFFFHMGGYGFDFESLEKDRKFVFLDYPVHEVDQIVNQSNAIYEIIHNTGAKRVVIDSIMPIALFFHNDDERKKGFLKFIENLRKWNVTIMIVSEDLKMSDQQGSPSSQYGIESFTDGWINLFYSYDKETMERNRYLEVIKMKGSTHSLRSVPVTLDSNGIHVGKVVTPKEPVEMPKKALEMPKKMMPAPEPKRMQPEKPLSVEEKPEEEDIDRLVERVFAAEPAMKPRPKVQPREEPPQPPKASNPPKPPAAKAEPQAPQKPKKLSGPGGVAMISSKSGSPPKPPAPAAKPKAPPPKAPPPKQQPAKKAPSPAKPPPPQKAAMIKLLSAKPPPQKPSAVARPPPAKMSDSIAQRIAEAKKKIMKKE